MLCDKCHAGVMQEFERRVGSGANAAVLHGARCDRCGYTSLDDDEDVWASVGL